jgi:diacylglycerol kinase family enzyme
MIPDVEGNHEPADMTMLDAVLESQTASPHGEQPRGRRRFFFVVNRHSGNYFKWVVQLRLGEFLTREGVSGEVHYLCDTETLRQELARAYDAGHRDFIVVGGDGTVSLVASLLPRKDCRLGIIPVGTTNMLAQLLGIPLGTHRALEMLLTSRQTRRIDALGSGERLFFLNASAGLSSFSISDLRTAEKSYFKLLAYVFAVTRSMRKAKTRRFHVEIDGQPQDIEAAELFIDNAGALWMPRYRTSDARLDDGLAEVCYVQKATPRELGNAVLDVLLVRKHRVALRRVASARVATIDCEEPIPVQADGDAVAFTPVELRVIPAAVCFIVPEVG